jgi:hypothetical protein
MAIITRVARVNLVAKKSKTGWSSMASFIRTNPAPQTTATKTSAITAQDFSFIVLKVYPSCLKGLKWLDIWELGPSV